MVAPTPWVEPRLSDSSTVFALAHFEGRMMIRHPVTLLGAAASAALAIFELRDEAPVLNRASVTLAWTMLPLAIAVALVAGWAVLRAAGRSDTQPPAVMPLGMDRRMAGIVVGLAFPAALALLLQLSVLVWLLSQDPVTSVIWSEFLTGPAYIVFAGTWSATFARWLPHPATPLFGVLTLTGLMIVFPYRQENWGSNIGIEWLSPLAWPQDIIPYEVAFRPADLHLGYLIGLGLILSGIAMLGRWVTAWSVLTAGALVAVTFGIAQLGPIEDTRQLEAMSRLVGDQADLTCETHNEVEYCAMPGYQGWIEEWVAASRPVLAAAPSDSLAGIEFRQYPVHNTTSIGPDDINGWGWIEPSYNDLARRPKVVPVGSVWADYIEDSVARDTAFTVLGCRLQCQGESQGVVYLWLASHNPQIQSIVRANSSGDSAPVVDCIVAELWTLSNARERIHTNWSALVDPATSYEAAGSLLGVQIPTGYDQNGYLENGCP